MGSLSRRSSVVAVGLILAFAHIATAPSASSVSDNDNLADATDLGTLPSPAATGPMIGNTAEVNEPAHGGIAAQQSIWFKWTSPATNTMTVHSCHSSVQFDSTIGVYSGPAVAPTFADLVTLTGNDDGCGAVNGGSRTSFGAIAGRTYYIALDRIGAGGTTYGIFFVPGPPNDAFSGTVISGSPLTVTGTNVGATKETGEPDHAGSLGGASVWWSWTAPSTDTFRVDTCGSNFDTLLAVYTGGAFTPGGITLVQSNDDSSSCFLQSALSLSATAGTVYRIAVDGKPSLPNDPEEGTITMHIAPRPANDDLADAAAITGTFPAGATSDTTAATRQTDENQHGGVTGTGSVWYSWLSTITGPVTFDTCGSAVDTLLAVYAPGGAFPLAAPIAENNDSCGTQSAVTIGVSVGTTYLIAVDQPGFGGPVQLQIHDVTAPTTTIDTFKVRQRKRTATLTFSGIDELPGTVTFECKRDGGAFASCVSGVVFRFRPGKHTIQVRAVDVSSNADATPDSRTFRIRRL